jgi:hypothetical protein
VDPLARGHAGHVGRVDQVPFALKASLVDRDAVGRADGVRARVGLGKASVTAELVREPFDELECDLRSRGSVGVRFARVYAGLAGEPLGDIGLGTHDQAPICSTSSGDHCAWRSNTPEIARGEQRRQFRAFAQRARDGA